MELTGYDLSRKWFNFCFNNPEKIRPVHTALFFFAIEHCNRLGWKSKFGFPTSMAMDAIGVRSYNSYIKALTDLIVFGFIKLFEKSKNQYSSNIIGLSYFDKAQDKALDRAFKEHSENHPDIDNIQENETVLKIEENKPEKKAKKLNTTKGKVDIIPAFYSNYPFFKDEFKDLWFNEFFPLKKRKKASLSERALTSQLNKINKYSLGIYEIAFEILEKSVNSGWTDFYELKNNSNGKSKEGCTYVELAEVLSSKFD
jgi:hypothetical protein